MVRVNTTIQRFKKMRIFNNNMVRVEIPTIVKWAGGKKQLLKQFQKFFPDKIENYFEPFVGGGAVLFYILQTYAPKKVLISDTNEELMNCYEVIKNDVEELILSLKKHKQAHNKEYYYKIRELDPRNLNKIERASRTIYLNKTCFNGLYRVNSKGGFNVPIGSYINPSIYNETELRKLSKLLKNVEIKVMSFEDILNYAKKNDFIYFDPPYMPLKKESFTTYTKDNFLEDEQKQLSQVFKKLHKKGCNVMLSNSDTEFIKNLYKEHNINIVKANRMINSNGKDRGKINEVVVTNYKPTFSQTKL